MSTSHLAIRALLWLLISVSGIRAERWRTTIGDEFDARLSGVYGPIAVFAEKGGSRQLTVEALDDAGIGRVADFIARRPAALPAWSKSTSAMAKALRGRLQVLRDGRLVAYETAALPEPEMYLIYFGAVWSDASRMFVPDLALRYREFKAVVGSRFELVFVSRNRDGALVNSNRDRAAAEHADFVRECDMPWPVIKFSSLGNVDPIERWDAAGVPSLVVLNPEAEVILDSQQDGGAFLEPRQVLNQFGELIGMVSNPSNAAKRGMHRLAVVQHIRAHPGGEVFPQPYVISIDRGRYRTLEVKHLVATLRLDEHGRVETAIFDPTQSAVIRVQLLQDAKSWLFLPGLKDGKPQPFTVRLPIEF